MVLPTAQFLTQVVVFDSNLLSRKTEKSYNLPQNVHPYGDFILFCILENNQANKWVVGAKSISKYGQKSALLA